MMGIHNYYSLMEKDNILFSFQGEISADLVSSILGIVESNLESVNEDTKIKKKVFNVLVECLQNLFHHLEDKPLVEKARSYSERSAIFMIGKVEDNYQIYTGNCIKNTKVTTLTKRLNELNKMTKEELREHYMATIADGEMSAKGGGGLGLIDIIRKTGEKLLFDFLSIDDEYSFFEFNVKVTK